MQKFDGPNTQAPHPSMWPDDWYVYDNNTVAGPFTASQAFSRQQTTEDGKPVLVSRKGFTQWYALKDLAAIFNISENLGRRIAEEKGFESLRQLAGEQALSGVSQTPLVPKIIKKQVSPVQSPTQIVQPTQMASAVSMPQYRPPAPSSSDSEITPTSQAALTSKTSNAKIAKVNEHRKTLQNYFFIRGRLRLGKMRNPWISAFLGVPLTLGIFWLVWMRTFLREVYMHAANHTTIPSSLILASIIPGFHFYAIYKTAELVRAMEAQNGYKSVSPWLAVSFGICPPVAMAYLQDAANRHWILHAQHSFTD